MSTQLQQGTTWSFKTLWPGSNPGTFQIWEMKLLMLLVAFLGHPFGSSSLSNCSQALAGDQTVMCWPKCCRKNEIYSLESKNCQQLPAGTEPGSGSFEEMTVGYLWKWLVICSLGMTRVFCSYQLNHWALFNLLATKMYNNSSEWKLHLNRWHKQSCIGPLGVF